MLPKGWTKQAVEDCADLLTGNAFRSEDYVEAGESAVRLLRGDNIIQGSLRWDDAKHWATPYAEALQRYEMRAGDIVLAMDRPIVNAGLKCSVVRQQDLPSLLVQRVARLRAKKNFDQGYLAHVLQTHRFIEHLKGHKTETAVPHISPNDIREFEFPCPINPVEQSRIAQILSTWDQAVSKAERLLQNSLKRKRGLTRDLVLGQRRFSQFAAPWQQHSFREVLKEVKRRVDWDDDQAYPLISVRRRSEGAFHRETLKGSEILTKKLNYAYAGEFLISKMQVVHGAMAVVPSVLDGMFVSDSYLAFQSADEDRFDINFIGWLSTTQQMYKAVRRCSYGVHIEKMTFDLDMFLNEKLNVPINLTEQRVICDVLERAQAEVKFATDHLEQLKKEKAALMAQLLTGKRRVKLPDAEAEVQA
jgi:type I restriction enzyme, S subunit